MAIPARPHRNPQATVPHHAVRGAPADRRSTRISRLTTVLYLLFALGAPALVHWGPDVLSPTAPAIANAALDGRLALPPHPLCAATKTLSPRRASAAPGC